MKNKSGIYKIMNNINKRVYIGSAKNLFTRKNKHFALLARNKHYNSFLQNDFNKHGFDKYIFSILEYCSVELLIETEQKWIDRHFDNQNMCYNILKEAGNSLGYKHKKQSLELQSKSQSGRKISKITKTKISKSNKIYWDNNTERKETLKEKFTGSGNPMWGKRLSKNHKISISKANKGKKMSKQTKEKIANAQKIPVLQFSSDSKTLINEWDSAKDASVALKINNSTIGLCCRGIRKTSGGFVWKYAHEYNISFEKK